MFPRRNPRKFFGQLKEFFYPDMGYRRTFKYMWHRISRLSDTTYNIAAGLAVGAAISFSPLVGTHFIQALAFAWLIRVNYLASMIGTFWGNPWTFPFIWYAGYHSGNSILGAFGIQNFKPLPVDMNISALWAMILEDPLRLFLPWMLGGYICAILFWPIAFFVSYFMVKSAKQARRRKRLATLRRRGLIRKNLSRVD